MKDKDGEIIYIGKAKVLRNRVSSYFRQVSKHYGKTRKMVETVFDFEYIVVNSEKEALLLECSLIKRHKPKYNILLKDDKGYSYIKISSDSFPRITGELQKVGDGEFIGPFMSAFITRQTAEEVNKAFKLRTCKRVFPRDFKKERPCLNFFIKRCVGVCRGDVSQEEYVQAIEQAKIYIKMGAKESVEYLREKMEEAAENLEFERAAKLRDRISAIEKSNERQSIFCKSHPNADFVGIVSDKTRLNVSVLKFRGGALCDKLDFSFNSDETDFEDTATEFLEQYYIDLQELPKEIFINRELPLFSLLSEVLSEKAGRKVVISTPVRGELLELVDMATKNAAAALSHKTAKRDDKEIAALDELKVAAGLSKTPAYIESYDISNLGDSSIVAGMVVFKDGKPFKRNYKKFKIKDTNTADDYASMREVIRRRFTRYKEGDGDEGFATLPDLLLIDGGKTHLAVVKDELRSLGLEIEAYGMVKDSKHRTRGLVGDCGELSLTKSKRAFNLLNAIQNEVHRFAITYQRSTRNKYLKSSITEVSGIGETRARALFLKFKTIKAMRAATVEELAAVPGMDKKAAEQLFLYLNSGEE